jgi:hypothetical protein
MEGCGSHWHVWGSRPMQGICECDIEVQVDLKPQMGFHPVAVPLRQHNTQMHKSHIV